MVWMGRNGMVWMDGMGGRALNEPMMMMMMMNESSEPSRAQPSSSTRGRIVWSDFSRFTFLRTYIPRRVSDRQNRDHDSSAAEIRRRVLVLAGLLGGYVCWNASRSRVWLSVCACRAELGG